MQAIQIQDRQTLFDLAIQHCGDREAAFQIADTNDLSLTEALSAGFSLAVPEPINQRVVYHYRTNSIIPATAAGTETTNAENSIITNDGLAVLITNNNNDIQIVANF